MKVRKKENVVLTATQLTESGVMATDREPMPYQAGDWKLETADGRCWPVDDEYFRANYEEVV